MQDPRTCSGRKLIVRLVGYLVMPAHIHLLYDVQMTCRTTGCELKLRGLAEVYVVKDTGMLTGLWTWGYAILG